LEENTGGIGKFNGGNGVRREIQFRKPLTVSVLTERRVFEPYGFHGGGNGKRGNNLLVRKNGSKIVNLGGKTSVTVDAEDVLCLLTPGGGGYGQKEN